MSIAPGLSPDLERRKHVRVRLRVDLEIITQRYEGRVYHVVKDPISLRYYRFKEQEYFLLNLMDGRTTLEQAQKRFEQRFRPERLTLEDLEAFASQLIQTGLAQNETPNAGKALFQNFKKRRNQQLLQAVMNILYIKVPVFDPDKMLTAMLPYLSFIFTGWFLMLSIATMLVALGMVATQWNVFISKLPSSHEFFSLQTVVYVWLALGIVKIIHEFGHGLSCKAFGGEVHEMGLLFLCLSPCMYCNVSDAWTMPNKWHRIIIGGAGIYVELMIAAFATFVWWSTDNGTFINNLAMSMMVVCSVSTVVFNGNPLMRFDGYYVLADWIEIPNLRDRANKYIQNLAMEHCLGIEVPPEQYMTLQRKILFIAFAVVSYIYRWIVTYSVLYFMYTFLQPYKLGVISFLLGTGAIGSMVGMPIYQLIRNVRRRGRLPDMKPVRVVISTVLVVILVVVILTIPFPLYVTGLSLVQIESGHVQPVAVPETGGILEELRIEDGAYVKAGQEIAILGQPELLIKLEIARQSQEQLGKLLALSDSGTVSSTQAIISRDIRRFKDQENDLLRELNRLTLRAPRDGRVLKLLPRDQIGKPLEGGTVICEVGNDEKLNAMVLVAPSDYTLIREGQRAWLRLHGRGYDYHETTVHERSSVEAKDIPPQLSNKAGGDVATEQDPMQQGSERPQHQHFMIKMRFKEVSPALQAGSMGRVKIEVGYQTLWWRFRRYLTTAFNLGL